MAEYNESQINSNETERISAEQQRIENEAKRQTNETEREAREATRQSNESTRISEYNTFMADAQSEYNSFITNAENAEDERIENEEGRIQAEASRVTAEQGRVEAENIRAEFYEGFNEQLTQKVNKHELVINVKDFGAKCDGVTNDTVALQSAIDFIETNNVIDTLFIPEGELLVTSKIYIDFSKVNVDCHGTILGNVSNDTIISDRNVVPTDKWEVYDQGGMTVRGLKIKGTGRENGATAIRLSVGTNDKGSSRIKFENCSIENVDTGIVFGARSYANTVENTSIYGCNKCIDIVSEYDTGERITFNQCNFFNSAIGISCNNPNASVYVINTSIDYCWERMIEVFAGSVFVENSHIEFTCESYMGNNIPFLVSDGDSSYLGINNSYILGAYLNDSHCKYIFDVQSTKYQGLSVTNCTLQGFRCTERIVKNEGVVHFSGNNTKQWDGFGGMFNRTCSLLKDPGCLNMDANIHLSQMYITNSDNLTIHRGDLEWPDGSHCWKIQKKSDTQTHGEVVFYGHYNGIDRLISGQIEITSSVDCSVDISYQGIKRMSDGTLKEFDMKRVGMIECKAGIAKCLIPDNRHGYIDNFGYDYVAISVGLFNAPEGYYKLKHFYLNTF